MQKESGLEEADVRLPGHAFITPDRRVIRLPKVAYTKLRRLRLLERDFYGPRTLDDDGRPIPEISADVYKFIGNELGFMLGISKLLGLNCEGPNMVVCNCR